MATPGASCGSPDVRYGIARAAGVEDFQMLLRRQLQPLQRLAEACAKQPEPRRVEAVVLADDFVFLEVDQVLVELVVAVQRRDADLPVFRRLCHRLQRLLDLGGNRGNRPRSARAMRCRSCKVREAAEGASAGAPGSAVPGLPRQERAAGPFHRQARRRFRGGVCRRHGRTAQAQSLTSLVPAGMARKAPAKFESIAGTRNRRHKEWRDPSGDPRYGPLYGAQKVAKMKLACHNHRA
jgi:hypothetical protein